MQSSSERARKELSLVLIPAARSLSPSIKELEATSQVSFIFTNVFVLLIFSKLSYLLLYLLTSFHVCYSFYHTPDSTFHQFFYMILCNSFFARHSSTEIHRFCIGLGFFCLFWGLNFVLLCFVFFIQFLCMF